jgi:Adenylate and Guanylate cyclase catalytic domain
MFGGPGSHGFEYSQLVGGPVNCAARMESTGKPGRIQCSPKTADLLTGAGKGSWVVKRDEMVQAKGKGMLQTYWVEPRTRGGGSSDSPSLTSDDDARHVMIGPIRRRGPDMVLIEKLVDWNMEHFATLAKRIVGRRAAREGSNARPGTVSRADPAICSRSEITEIVSLPAFDFNVDCSRSGKGPPAEVVLAPEVVEQMRHYISTVAHMYFCFFCFTVVAFFSCTSFNRQDVGRHPDRLVLEAKLVAPHHHLILVCRGTAGNDRGR